MPFRGIAVDYKGRIHDDPVVAERDDTRRNELLAHGIKPYEIRKAHYDNIDYMDSFVTKIRRDLRLPPTTWPLAERRASRSTTRWGKSTAFTGAGPTYPISSRTVLKRFGFVAFLTELSLLGAQAFYLRICNSESLGHGAVGQK